MRICVSLSCVCCHLANSHFIIDSSTSGACIIAAATAALTHGRPLHMCIASQCLTPSRFHPLTSLPYHLSPQQIEQLFKEIEIREKKKMAGRLEDKARRALDAAQKAEAAAAGATA
jgi:hypothetical protein